MLKNYNAPNASVNITLIDVGEEDNAVINATPPTQRFHYIIHYVIAGNGIFKSSNQEHHKLMPGNAFAIYKHDTVYYESDHDAPLHYYWIGFNGYDSERLLQYLGFSKTNQVIRLKNQATIKEAFAKLLSSSSNNDTYATFSNFFECLKIIREANYEETPPVLMLDSLLSSAIAYMETNIYKRITIEDLVHELNVDRTAFSKKFKAKFNVPPHKYFLKLKLSKAALLLESSEYNIGQISELLGFTDNYIFSKTFKKHYGISPYTYRKLRRNKKSKKRLNFNE